MKVSQLIEQLSKLHKDSECTVIVHNKCEDFSICYGGGCEGTPICDPRTTVSFYVDRLNNSEKPQIVIDLRKK